MHKNAHRLGFAAVLFVAVFFLQSGHALAQLPQKVVAGNDPLVGVWKLNVQKSHYERGGPSRPGNPPNALLVWTYKVEKGGVRMSVYPMGMAPQPARSFLLKWDNKEYPDPQGPGRHESVIYWRMDAKMLTRLVLAYKSDEDRADHRNPKRQEWVSWCVSEDGKTLAVNAWDPATPEYTNRQIFDRQPD